jgi:TonB family protein
MNIFRHQVFLALVVLAMGAASSAAQQGDPGVPASGAFVPATVMASYCTTMVSPNYPSSAQGETQAAVVVLRATIRRSGAVSPLYAVSGPHALESAAMDAARLWRYRPYLKDGEAVEVTTEISVEFVPGRPGGMVTHPGMQSRQGRLNDSSQDQEK